MARKKDEGTSADWLKKGLDHGEKRKMSEAKKCFKKAIEFDEGSLDAWFYLGCAYEYQGDHPIGIMPRQDDYIRAIEAFEKMITIDPDDRRAWDHMGLCYEGLGIYSSGSEVQRKNFELSRDCFQKAVEIDPDSSKGWRHLGKCHMILDDHEPALECFERAVSVYPDDMDSKIKMIDVLIILGRYDDAIDHSKGILGSDPGNRRVKKLLRRAETNIGWKNDGIDPYNEFGDSLKKEKVELNKAEARRFISIIREFILNETGLSDQLKPNIEYAEFQPGPVYEYPDGKRTLAFGFLFNEDQYGMYDKFIQFIGYLTLDGEGKVMTKVLKVTHIGPAAHFEPKKSLLE